MATLAQIRDGLKTTVSNISGLRCYDTVPDNAINFPVAIFIPTEIEFDLAMQPFIRVSPQTESGQFLDPDLYIKNIFKTAETKTADEKAMKEKALERKTPFDLSDPFQAAGGGIAKLAGDPSGAMLESMNPDSQGLSGLLKRGTNT